MNDIFKILENNNIMVPAEAKDNIRKEVAENYKTLGEFEQKMNGLQEAINNAEERAGKAEKALKSLGDIEPEKVTETIEQLKKDLEEEKKKYKADIENREYNDLIKTAMEGLEFSSESAKKAFLHELNGEEKLKVKNGQLIGFDDYVKAFSAADPNALVDSKNRPPEFTQPQHKDQGGPVTKESIEATKNRAERQKLIAENIGLYLGKE